MEKYEKYKMYIAYMCKYDSLMRKRLFNVWPTQKCRNINQYIHVRSR